MRQRSLWRLTGAIALGVSVGLWAGCAGDDQTAAPAGAAVEVKTATTGQEIDSDGYTLSLDSGAGQAIAANGSVTISGMDAGDHHLELAGMAANCVVDGKNPRTVAVTGGGRAAQTTFQVSCTATALRNQIVFTGHSLDDWDDGIYDNEIYVMNVDGSGLMDLTNNPANDHSPAVSPDGKRILFVTDRAGAGEIFVMNADGSGLVDLTNDPAWDGHPVWSPDGTKIAFASYRDDTGANDCYSWDAHTACSDVFVMNADGSNPVNLTKNSTAIDWEPTWSPDGTKIAFASDRDAGGTPDCPDCWEIFVMNADGSNVVKLADYHGPSAGGFSPAWSPDGARIAFTRGCCGLGIWVMGADGSNPVELTAALNGFQARWPSWSPDGSRIAFTMVSPITANDNEVFIMNADGSNPVNLSSRPEFDDFANSTQAWGPQR